MICELLLENGADPLTESTAGVSPLCIASSNGHKDVVRVLLKFGADPTTICREVSICPHTSKDLSQYNNIGMCTSTRESGEREWESESAKE